MLTWLVAVILDRDTSTSVPMVTPMSLVTVVVPQSKRIVLSAERLLVDLNISSPLATHRL